MYIYVHVHPFHFSGIWYVKENGWRTQLGQFTSLVL